MKLSLVSAAVIALTVGAVGIASADENPAPPAPAVSGTPLAPRPSHPLALQPTHDSSTPVGYKIIAGVGVAAAAALWLRNKKKAAQNAPGKKSRVDVLARQSVGVRSDLLVIDVEGTRLLVGVTPSSMQTLAVLETPVETAELAESEKNDETAPVPMIELGERVRSLLAARDEASEGVEAASAGPKPRRATMASRATTGTVKTAAKAPTATAKRPRVAGQAKGLLLALEDPAAADAKSGSGKKEDAPIRLGDW